MLGYGNSMLLGPEMKTSQHTCQQLLNMVWQNLQQKDIRQAISNSNLLGRKYPDFAPGWHAASQVAQLIRQPQSALVAIDRALTLEPANIDWKLHRAGCLLMCGDNENAERYVQSLVTDSGHFSNPQLSQLAFLCNRLELHDEAAQIYKKLIRLEPKVAGH